MLSKKERTTSVCKTHNGARILEIFYYERALDPFTPLVLCYTYLPVHEDQENTEAVYLERYTVNQFVNEDPKDSFSAL
jgi:hypothetical protein